VASALGVDATRVQSIGSLPAVTAEVSANALSKLNADPNVVLVTPDTPMPPTLFKSVPEIGGDKVQALGYTGTNYSVAVLDTGVQADHPALAGTVIAEACFSTQDSDQYKVRSLCPGHLDMSTLPGSAQKCPSNIDGCEHGTHVAGIIAGHHLKTEGRTFDGVAPGAKIVAIQVFTEFDQPDVCGGAGKCVRSFTSDQLRALDWVYKKRDNFKIAAVNMSLGGGYHDKNCDKDSALTEVIQRLRAKGILTVVAAGNDRFYDGLAEPACISTTVSVAAEDVPGHLDTSYSNVSPLVHISAPGTGIVSTVPGSSYKVLSGTSMAAPHVAAAFAVLRQEYPNDTADQLEQLLIANAPTAGDDRTGTKLPALELYHTALALGTAGPAVAGAPPPNPEAPQPNAAPVPAATIDAKSGSFIVQSPQSQADLESTLGENCVGVKCDLKPISPGSFKLDIKPTGADNTPTLDKGAIEKMFNGKDVKVYNNSISAPFK
jgi:subtilisin family serine protease